MITFDNKIVTYNDKDGMISLTPSTIGDDTYSWQGRRLMSISGTKNIQFEYNDQGLRTFKRVDTGQTLNSNKIYKDYEYVYDLDNKLICQRVTYLNSIDTMIFLYHDNYLYGFEYAQSKYFYLRDSLGNINGIIDSTGKLVVEYVYNAFGKIIDILGEMKDTIGVNNPMRYKGYYYDSETQMYYCKSRYYNPDFCRWISGDSEKYIDTETPLGLNLFIYCFNCPTEFYDDFGNAPKWLRNLLDIGLYVVSAVVAVVVGVAVGNLVTSVAGPKAGAKVGIIAAVTTFGAINNLTNEIYYNFISDGESELTPGSYRDGYVNRWDRLDYTKEMTEEKYFNLNAWRYFSEYNTHMYSWYLFGWAYKKDIPLISYLAERAYEADIDTKYFEDGKNRWRNIIYIGVGLLGL